MSRSERKDGKKSNGERIETKDEQRDRPEDWTPQQTHDRKPKT